MQERFISKISMPSIHRYVYINDTQGIEMLCIDSQPVYYETESSSHNIIPHTIVNHNKEYASIPSINKDSYACITTGDLPIIPAMPGNGDYELWLCVQNGVKKYLWVLQ